MAFSLSSKPLVLRGKKQVFTGEDGGHISPPLPHGDFQQPQGSFVVNYRLWRSLELHKHHSPLGLAPALRPVQPVTLIRPHAAKRAARFFVEKFPGRSLYAVKANPSPDLLRILWDSGVTHYDVASIAEVRLVAETLPDAVQCFMHPVKAEEAIAEAYALGVRTFSLDTMDELEKIVRATSTDGVEAGDLNLCVRIRVSSDHSKLSLASKFGAEPDEM